VDTFEVLADPLKILMKIKKSDGKYLKEGLSSMKFIGKVSGILDPETM
jgi:hypothetical protein